MRTETIHCANGCGRELGTVEYDDETPSEPQGVTCDPCRAAAGEQVGPAAEAADEGAEGDEAAAAGGDQSPAGA